MNGTCQWYYYQFTICLYSDSGSYWGSVPGVYIFAGVNSQNQWFSLYIDECSSFRDCLLSPHEMWSKAQSCGATHVHALMVKEESTRVLIKEQLIQRFQPSLNNQVLFPYQKTTIPDAKETTIMSNGTQAAPTPEYLNETKSKLELLYQ